MSNPPTSAATPVARTLSAASQEAGATVGGRRGAVVLSQELDDGTRYVGEIGVLAVDEDADRVQCHLCGRWLRSLAGSHLRVTHGWTGEQYR
ncbi:MAG: hypothetical protein ACR2KL_05000, partial [Nocardioidaceae bacterium]